MRCNIISCFFTVSNWADKYHAPMCNISVLVVSLCYAIYSKLIELTNTHIHRFFSPYPYPGKSSAMAVQVRIFGYRTKQNHLWIPQLSESHSSRAHTKLRLCVDISCICSASITWRTICTICICRHSHRYAKSSRPCLLFTSICWQMEFF